VAVISPVPNLPYLDIRSGHSGPHPGEAPEPVAKDLVGVQVGDSVVAVGHGSELTVGRPASLLDSLGRRGGRHPQPDHRRTLRGQQAGHLVQPASVRRGVGHDLAQVPATQHDHHYIGVSVQRLPEVAVDPGAEQADPTVRSSIHRHLASGL
ncbi:uncharacterized protein METZ01_LOCUS25518, partial [marine metagenome]